MSVIYRSNEKRRPAYNVAHGEQRYLLVRKIVGPEGQKRAFCVSFWARPSSIEKAQVVIELIKDERKLFSVQATSTNGTEVFPGREVLLSCERLEKLSNQSTGYTLLK